MRVRLRRHRTALRWSAVGLLAVVIIGLLIHTLTSGPAQGTISIPATPNQTDSFNTQPVAVTNAYASFDYPAAFSPTATAKPTAPLMASYGFNHTQDINTWHLAISIIRLHDSSLEADNSYQFRQTQPDRYHITTLHYDGADYTVSIDTQASGFSEVGYLLHGDYSADISVVGYDPQSNADLQRTMNIVLTSWQWQ